MLNHQNNYVADSNMTMMLQKFWEFINQFKHNYFNDPLKLFSDLYLTKVLNTSKAKSFFLCKMIDVRI